LELLSKVDDVAGPALAEAAISPNSIVTTYLEAGVVVPVVERTLATSVGLWPMKYCTADLGDIVFKVGFT
jgi:hypothetical protein